MKHGKKYNEMLKKYDPSKKYDVAEACKLVKDLHYAKFDETVELSISLKLEKNQTVRDTLVFPHQFTGEKRVLVFCKEERVKEALDAGATYAGAAEYIEKVKGGWTDFDVAVNAFSRRVPNKIIFTDGYADMPKKEVRGAIWVIFGDEKINPKGGKVINITGEQLRKLYRYEKDTNLSR